MIRENKVYIRKCSDKDIDAIYKIGVQSYKEHYSYLWEDNCAKYLSRTLSKEILKEDIANSNIHFFLVEDNKNAVGIFKIKKDSAILNYKSELAIEIEKIYFLKKFTGKGLGSMSLNFITSYAQELNKKILWLDVIANSPALRFYEKIGFKKSGETYLDLPLKNSEYNKMYVMTKLL